MTESGDQDKLARIVTARLKLRERFLMRTNATPSLSDDVPMGTGALNRHGMPRVPPEQSESKKWPVLDLGTHPDIALADWQLRIDGACASEVVLGWDDFMGLEQVDDISDFHCVTKWSRFDVEWTGVRLADVIALARPDEDAEYVMCHAYDGYTVNIPLAEAMKPDVLLVHRADRGPLPRDHGGPVRVITPQLYAWKGAKWVNRIELLVEDRLGFWETRGYSSTAHPWRNDRYEHPDNPPEGSEDAKGS